MRKPIVLERLNQELALEEECRCCAEAPNWATCPECHGTRIVPSYEGLQIIDFMRRWLLQGDDK